MQTRKVWRGCFAEVSVDLSVLRHAGSRNINPILVPALASIPGSYVGGPAPGSCTRIVHLREFLFSQRAMHNDDGK